jgi:hypothetical protein
VGASGSRISAVGSGRGSWQLGSGQPAVAALLQLQCAGHFRQPAALLQGAWSQVAAVQHLVAHLQRNKWTPYVGDALQLEHRVPVA